MQEAKFLGGLLPVHPDFKRIIETTRAKYSLREVYPLDEPIDEIYLYDEIIPLEEFSKEIRNQILVNMDVMFPEEFVKQYRSAEYVRGMDYQKGLDEIPEALRQPMDMMLRSAKNTAQTLYQILDAQIDAITVMICNHLLLGDSMEVPQDWFGKTMTMDSGGETIIFAMISEITNLDLIFQEIRTLHKKTYRKEPTKVTAKTANTAYYLQLMKRKKDRDFVLDEFIKLNNFRLPSKNSPRYVETRNKYWQRLRKRLKKAMSILDAIVREKN